MIAADTIRILVATDNHVGYAERDHERGNDSAETFEEILSMAKERDVDMDESSGDISTSVLDSDFDVDFPTHTAQGTLLTLEEREEICHQKLVGLAEEVKSATNSKAAELAKIKWTRAW